MKIITLLISLLGILQGCDPNNHNPTDHPCNFPDAGTENGLRNAFSFKILDKVTFKNVVDTLENSRIHPDSVRLFDSDWNEIDPKPRFRFDNEWIFDNFPPYINVPFNNPQALLDLETLTFYLTTSNNDIDTIEVFFTSCLVAETYFNKLSAQRPENVQTSASFYFKK